MDPKSRLGPKTRRFAIDVLAYADRIRGDYRGRIAREQLIRSSTSIGANYLEACHARTRKEFVSKLSISLQEAEESRYWLDVARNARLGPYDEGTRLSSEGHEIIKMLVASIKTAKRNSRIVRRPRGDNR